MTPVTSHVRSLTAYLTAWLLVGAGMATFLVSTHHASGAAALAFSVPVCVVYGFVAASAYYVCRTLPLADRHGARTVMLFGAASLSSGILWTLLCHAWNSLGYALALFADFDPGANNQLLEISPEMSLMLVLLGSAAYLISLLLHDGLMAADRLQRAQTREAESRVQARDAELQVLRAQINPHFLFNSLNSISALTSIDAAAARRMTLELAAFFRQTLALSERESISLADEVSLCGHFLAIEKIRFEDRLATRIEVSAAAAGVLIPPMLLQPCVENAVKHGIRNLADGGCISLRAWVRGHWLYVVIENPLDSDCPPGDGTGTGLNNIRRRLQTRYGDQARVSWSRVLDQFSVEIVIPIDARNPNEL
ncbi:MAG: histidine kinase [Betaproteobacteria bacterium]